MIDIGTAIDLLTSVVTLRGKPRVYRPAPASTSNSNWEPHCIVRHALVLACGGVKQLEALEDEPIQQLYEQDRLPVRLTLGALVVLDAAQRREDQDSAWADVLAHATTVARRYVELIPAAHPRTHPGAPAATSSSPGATADTAFGNSRHGRARAYDQGIHARRRAAR